MLHSAKNSDTVKVMSDIHGAQSQEFVRYEVTLPDGEDYRAALMGLVRVVGGEAQEVISGIGDPRRSVSASHLGRLSTEIWGDDAYGVTAQSVLQSEWRGVARCISCLGKTVS